MASGKLTVTLTGSYIGCTDPQRRTLRALGLRKHGDKREHDSSPAINGMVDAVKHLIAVEQAE
jgi:large subunit ribosomal protein L30